MKAFAIRNKKNNEDLEKSYFGKCPPLFSRIGSARASLRNYLKDWWTRRQGYAEDDFEIVEYELVEVAVHPARSKK